ncbi:MAG: hypothetical protein ACI8Z7_000150 [Candidatus Nanohaloarchaea archaeon]|jgi:hypothetical protein
MGQRFQNKKTASSFTALTLLLFLTVMLSFSATAQESTENNLDVNINISEKTIVDIQPKTFSWGAGTTQVQPGDIAGPNKEANGYGRIQIENLGSVNITQLWFNTTFPTQRPFGKGNSDLYDSANFIALDSNTTGVNDHNQFVNRKEYGLDQSAGADTQDIIYLDTPSNWDYGRFRDSSSEYFWTVDDTGGGDLGGATFRIGVDHHNESQTGSTNLDEDCQGGPTAGSNTDCNGYTLSTTSAEGTTWAYTAVEVGALDSTNLAIDGDGKYYCAVMNSTQVTKNGADESDRPAVYFLKWNKGFPSADQGDCGYATNYTIGSDGEFESLTPGQWITQNIRARVPYGVVSAELPTGSLYVLANSQ